MRQPELVSECVQAMDPSSGIVSVKCRIGVDEMDSEQFLVDFAGAILEAGCTLLIVHARKAWLKGVSPKQNRTLPPLNYDRVYALKRFLPKLRIVINGGIDTLDECERHLEHVHGVMLGRSIYAQPMLLQGVDQRLYGESACANQTPEDVLEAMLTYLEHQDQDNPYCVIRHALGLYRNTPGAREARRALGDVRTLSALEKFLGARKNYAALDSTEIGTERSLIATSM
jgi:tRNA-dihydrouridine synthase A